MQILRTAFRFSPERSAFLFPPGTEVTVDCLSATRLGPDIINQLSSLGIDHFPPFAWDIIAASMTSLSAAICKRLGRAMIRLGVGTEELAFLSTLALLSTDSQLISSSDHVHLLRDVENNLLKSFRLLFIIINIINSFLKNLKKILYSIFLFYLIQLLKTFILFDSIFLFN